VVYLPLVSASMISELIEGWLMKRLSLPKGIIALRRPAFIWWKPWTWRAKEHMLWADLYHAGRTVRAKRDWRVVIAGRIDEKEGTNAP